MFSMLANPMGVPTSKALCCPKAPWTSNQDRYGDPCRPPATESPLLPRGRQGLHSKRACLNLHPERSFAVIATDNAMVIQIRAPRNALRPSPEIQTDLPTIGQRLLLRNPVSCGLLLLPTHIPPNPSRIVYMKTMPAPPVRPPLPVYPTTPHRETMHPITIRTTRLLYNLRTWSQTRNEQNPEPLPSHLIILRSNTTTMYTQMLSSPSAFKLPLPSHCTSFLKVSSHLPPIMPTLNSASLSSWLFSYTTLQRALPWLYHSTLPSVAVGRVCSGVPS